jgi:integrase
MHGRSDTGGLCMKGSIFFRKDRGIWVVKWYDKQSKKAINLYRYKGELMYNRKIAQKLLSVMQADYENGVFNIEKYRKNAKEAFHYLNDWFNDIKDELAPATAKTYKSYIKNHLGPFFAENPMDLNDIQYDVLLRLLKNLKLSGKGKANVMYALHSCLDHAWRSRRIEHIPPFPKKKYYQIQEPVIKWLPESRQMAILEKIPEEHQPIFYFLKYHVRRPAEAMALYKEDYVDGAFIIRRSISARKIIPRTKTSQAHIVPCHSDFLPYLEQALKSRVHPFSPFLFKNKTSKVNGRYSSGILNNIWKEACRQAGEDIPLYAGLKHSSCSQFINEKGLSMSDVQIITDHARLDSVKKYAKTEIARKRELMETGPKLVRLKNLPKK